MSHKSISLVVGANGGIAKALCQQLLEDADILIVAVSRKPQPLGLVNQNIKWMLCDHQPTQVKDIIGQLQYLQLPIRKVFLCTGLLHQEAIQPEKKIEQFDPQHFEQVLKVNVHIPTLWIQQLIDVCKSQERCIITVFSARVGSISDNRLGGWYSYRMSKAALNMMIKTAAVEYGRRAKNVKLIAFHPGTTDTGLSKPFQTNVPAGKLFMPEFVAAQLLSIIADLEQNQAANLNCEFLDWQGKSVAW